MIEVAIEMHYNIKNYKRSLSEQMNLEIKDEASDEEDQEDYSASLISND